VVPRIACALLLTAAAGLRVGAQGPPQAPAQLSEVIATVGAPPALLRFNNRPITTLRATVLSRTPAERAAAAAAVLNRTLGEGTFYVHYTLLVCLENPHQRSATLGALHANILDAFNEFGVQIASPNYEADPDERKVVPKDQWYSAPALPPERIENEKA